jgi:molecular chaperone DnaK
MVKEAEAHAEEDKKRVEEIDARNTADQHAEDDRKRRDEAETRNLAESLQYQTEKFLAENGDKIPEDKKTELTDALGELRAALGGSDLTAIKSAQEKVSQLSQAIGGALYQQAQAQQASSQSESANGSSGTQDDDEVVEAEIVDEGDSESEKR